MSTEQLEIEVSDQKKNQLLGRTELKIQVKHIGKPTPTRKVLRAEVGRISKSSPERVFIRKIVTDYGAGISECLANVYATSEAGEAVESEYIRTRNIGPSAKEPEAPKEPQPTAEKAPAPIAPEAPAPAKEKSVETKGESKVSTPKPEEVSNQADSKSKVPKKKHAKEKSAEAAAPEKEKSPNTSESPNP